MRIRAWTATLASLLALLFVQGASASAGLRFDRDSGEAITSEACWDKPGPKATVKWVPYSSFVKGRTAQQLYLDVYVPPSDVPGPYPAVVMVHGGGWVAGCRIWNDGMSFFMARKGFLVFNIDYRLACDNGNVYLCGFRFPTPIDDVKAAISWVRANAQTYGSFTGKVAAVGTSAGGNLVYMAGDTATGDSRPDVMASGSGHPEMGYMSPQQGTSHSACAESDDPSFCFEDSTVYIGAKLDGSQDWCGDGGGDNWSPASPACNINPSSLPPPTFIANATHELSAYRSATDYANELEASGVSFELCSVGAGPEDPVSHFHGTQLFSPTVSCNESGVNTFDEMINFIQANLPP